MGGAAGGGEMAIRRGLAGAMGRTAAREAGLIGRGGRAVRRAGPTLTAGQRRAAGMPRRAR